MSLLTDYEIEQIAAAIGNMGFVAIFVGYLIWFGIRGVGDLLWFGIRGVMKAGSWLASGLLTLLSRTTTPVDPPEYK